MKRLLTRLRPQKTRTSQASSDLRLVVGLRNPGGDYEGTRHNVGSEVVRVLAERNHVDFGRAPRQVRGELATVGIGDQRVFHLLPNTFMNQSGGPVSAALRYFKLPAESMLVIHDDIDLPFGRLKLQDGRGSGGHNGIRSVESSLGTNAFWRLKVGVGRPPGSQDPADFVLRRFSKSERTEVDVMVQDAADVVEEWLTNPPRAQESAAHRGRDV